MKPADNCLIQLDFAGLVTPDTERSGKGILDFFGFGSIDLNGDCGRQRHGISLSELIRNKNQQDYQDVYFVFINFRAYHAIVPNKQDDGGKNLMKSKSTFGGYKNFILTGISLFIFGAIKFWSGYAYYYLPCRRQLGFLCYIQKQRIKNRLNPVNPVKG